MKITKLNKNAAAIMVNRYSLRDESGHPVESPAEILMRTSRVVAEAENNYRSSGDTAMEVREKFFEMLYEMRFVPNGRTMANAGTKYGQLANCFVLPVEDDLGKGTDSIFSVLRKAILTLQTGGGVGFSFGRIRPKDATISTTKGKATGAVSFIKVYDTAFWVIGQGGGRRSAAMAVLPVWHPDILEFIRCKATEGQITNFNISVGITDEFMKAVKNNDDFTLRHPENGEMYRMIPARELFAEIVKYAHKNGEPGVLFLDAANASNPVPHLYKLEATNPCGEQFLGPYENCCLGSLNLREHVKKIKGDGYQVDWEKLSETVQLATRFLDNVVDANKYVSAVPELEEAAHKVRRIGLSVMGLSDMMYMTGVRYGSAKGQELASQIMEFIRYHSMLASVELARVRGPFPGINGSIYDPQNVTWAVPKPLVPHKTNFERPEISWKKSISKKYAPWVIPTITIFVLIVLSSLFLFLKELPSPANLGKSSSYPISTKILDRNGKLLYEIYDAQNRTPVKLDELPEHLKQATISIEDKNFYTHHGFDTGGLLRAAWKTLSGQRLEGGSTITQQLVKVALLTPERTVSRKVKEAILTVATEILYSKNQILEMYLNHIPYGGTSYGIEAASHTFFNKSSHDLSVAEATLLVGLPQAPSRYSPFVNPDTSKSRQSLVLDRMVEDGYLNQEEAASAKNTELTFADSGTDIRAPHFVMYVRELLEEKYGVKKLEQGGLRVTTTLDIDLQDVAQASLSAELTTLKKLKISNGAALVTNPGTGEILSMIGSKDYFSKDIDGKVNVTTRLRQPGSSIKPLNYALGLETKVITPSTMLLDTPVCFDIPGQPDYCPKNYDNSFRGLTQIRFALGNSYNIAAVKVLALNSLEGFISFARKMGISTWNDPSQYGLSLTLGGGEVMMTDMATAFGVFANQGVKVPLHAILKVEDNTGKVYEEYNPEDGLREGDKVLSDETAFLISHILSDNNARSAAFGTGSVLNVPGKTVSVKTGTTNNQRDNWTIGYTPNLLVATWVGNNDNSPMSYVASGVTGASPIWQKIMRYALKDVKTAGIEKPESIEGASVCSNSGTLPTAETPCETRYEYFLPGTVPTINSIVKKDLFINRTTHHPPNNDAEAGDVETQNKTVASDPFVKDYCIDCEPYPEGYSEPVITIPHGLQ